jgi:hypothetical protein
MMPFPRSEPEAAGRRHGVEALVAQLGEEPEGLAAPRAGSSPVSYRTTALLTQRVPECIRLPARREEPYHFLPAWRTFGVRWRR